MVRADAGPRDQQGWTTCLHVLVFWSRWRPSCWAVVPVTAIAPAVVVAITTTVVPPSNTVRSTATLAMATPVACTAVWATDAMDMGVTDTVRGPTTVAAMATGTTRPTTTAARSSRRRRRPRARRVRRARAHRGATWVMSRVWSTASVRSGWVAASRPVSARSRWDSGRSVPASAGRLRCSVKGPAVRPGVPQARALPRSRRPCGRNLHLCGHSLRRSAPSPVRPGSRPRPVRLPRVLHRVRSRWPRRVHGKVNPVAFASARALAPGKRKAQATSSVTELTNSVGFGRESNSFPCRFPAGDFRIPPVPLPPGIGAHARWPGLVPGHMRWERGWRRWTRTRRYAWRRAACPEKKRGRMSPDIRPLRFPGTRTASPVPFRPRPLDVCRIGCGNEPRMKRANLAGRVPRAPATTPVAPACSCDGR